MSTPSNIRTAEALTRIGLAVFPVYVKPDPGNPYRTTKKPGTPNGFFDATLDTGYVSDLFEKHPKAEVGIWVGESGLVAADIDVKREPDGTITTDGFDEFEKSWLPLPDTHNFDSISGAGGKQFLYAAPDGKTLAPNSNYRGIKGVDRRGGNSYSVWNGPVPTSRAVFTPAPEWLLDERTVKSADKFEGSVKEWFETLEPGEPNVLVRGAMDRARQKFEALGDDYSHNDVVERQYEAIRLGAEGNPGVPELLELIEELFLSRSGAHSRPEDEWDYEFAEGLASGIEKHGAAISLRKNLPPYTLGLVPTGVPDRLIAGETGNKETFRDLLATLLPLVSDDLTVTSILWNSPRTKELSREWGLEFVHRRVQEARVRPEPSRENPTLPDPERPLPENLKTSVQENLIPDAFLSATEFAKVMAHRTFIDTYLDASATKGFSNRTYAVPAAWTAMSMAFGCRAFVPKGINIGTNLWFIVLGYSGTGKSAEDDFLTDVLDAMFKDGEGYYNLGADSSPEGLHEELLVRDGKASIIHHDEASDFFESIQKKDWMASLKDKFAKWYVGRVDPSHKVRLKELKGKSARTSFNMHFLATPDRLTKFLDTSMFASGFLARVNWLWAAPPESDEYKYKATLSEVSEHGVNPSVYPLAADLLHAAWAIGQDAVAMSAGAAAKNRLEKAYRDFDHAAKKHEKYEFVEPAVTRLGRETIWKCSMLLALYDGRTTISELDALTAIHYAEEWFHTLLRVVDTTTEGEFSRDVAQIEAYVRAEGGTVSQTRLLHRFRAMIVRSPRELDDRVGFLVSSGRLNRKELSGNKIAYELNG